MPLPGAHGGPRFIPSDAESRPEDTDAELPSERLNTESPSPSPRPRTQPRPRTESPSPSPSPRPTATPHTATKPESASPSDPFASYPTAPRTTAPLRDDGTPFVIERHKRPGASPLDLLPQNVREQIDAAAETAEQAAQAAYELAKRNQRTTAAIGAALIFGGLYLAARRR